MYYTDRIIFDYCRQTGDLRTTFQERFVHTAIEKSSITEEDNFFRWKYNVNLRLKSFVIVFFINQKFFTLFRLILNKI